MDSKPLRWSEDFRRPGRQQRVQIDVSTSDQQARGIAKEPRKLYTLDALSQVRIPVARSILLDKIVENLSFRSAERTARSPGAVGPGVSPFTLGF